MSIFAEVLNNAAHPAEEVKGDYRKDGLLYCGKCKTPKEMKLPNIFGIEGSEPKIVAIPCACKEAELDAEIAERKKHERMTKIEETLNVLESIGAVNRPGATFDRCDHASEKSERTMRKYADKFDIALEKNVGMLLCGKPGCGKTFFAECIANKLLEDGRMVMYTSIRKIADAPKDEREFVMRYVKTSDLLVLDDLGAERNTEYMNEKTYEVINARYEAKKPMIITTNLSPNEMASESDLHYYRAYNRVLEICKPILITGPERRMMIASKKMSDWDLMMKD